MHRAASLTAECRESGDLSIYRSIYLSIYLSIYQSLRAIPTMSVAPAASAWRIASAIEAAVNTRVAV
jgi:hypothetical protein